MKRLVLPLVCVLAGCLEAPTIVGPEDMSSEPDALPDITSDASRDATQDMPADLPTDVLEDLPSDASDMPPDDTCLEIGVMECMGRFARRYCSVEGQWKMLDPCMSRCDGAGECRPDALLNDLNLLGSYTMPKSQLANPAWTESVLMHDGGVFGGWQFQSDTGHVREGAIHTVTAQDSKTLSWEASWHPQLPATFGGNCAEFGRSLAISQDGLLLAVGAPGISLTTEHQPRVDMMGVLQCTGYPASDKDGAVYLFTRTEGSASWTHRQTLTYADTAPRQQLEGGALFGLALEMSPRGELLYIGSPGSNGSGEVHVFNIERAVSEGTLATHQRRIFDNILETREFGSSLALANGRLVIGARNTVGPNNEYRYGAVFVADARDATSTEAIRLITPMNLTEENTESVALGQRVSISGDGTRVVAGAGGAVYTNNEERKTGRIVTWDLGEDPSQTQPLTTDISSELTPAGSGFGGLLSISYDGERLLAGAPSEGDPVGMAPFPKEGAVVLFVWDSEKEEWKPPGSVVAQEYPNRASFGRGISQVSGAGRVLISSGDEPHSGEGLGVFYEFVLSD